jgi:alpha-glucosidase
MCVVAVTLLACTACSHRGMGAGRLSAPGVASTTFTAGAFELSWSGGSEAGLHIQHSGRTVWESVPGRAFVGAARGRESVRESRGLFTVKDTLEERCLEQRVESLVQEGDAVEVRGALACDDGEVGYTLRFQPRAGRQLGLVLTLADASFNRTALTLASTADEGMYGLGEQFTYFDLKGRRVPIVVSEQGIGRGEFPITQGANLTAGAGGGWHTTYSAVPHLLTSRLRSLFLENTELSIFDLRAD